jgi:DNA-binding transcriptional regulator of glucitol operon
MEQLQNYSPYIICVLATVLLGWWLWRSWQTADDEPSV